MGGEIVSCDTPTSAVREYLLEQVFSVFDYLSRSKSFSRFTKLSNYEGWYRELRPNTFQGFQTTQPSKPRMSHLTISCSPVAFEMATFEYQEARALDMAKAIKQQRA